MAEHNSEQYNGSAPDPESDAPVTLSAQERESASAVEALLFASDAPVPLSRIARITELSQGMVKKAIDNLNRKYEESANTFRIQQIAGGYQMMSKPEYFDILKELKKSRKETSLSRAALETLAIIAYRQPILRADVEAIRGVASGEVIRNLIEKKLVKITGRAPVIGRPMLYGTTKTFLDIFGLGTLDDLPRAEELRTPSTKPSSAPADSETADTQQQETESGEESQTDSDPE